MNQILPFRWNLLLWPLLLVFIGSSVLSLVESFQCWGGRYVCLFESYHNVQGPYFSALFDQLVEQTLMQQRNLAYCTTRRDMLPDMLMHLDGLKVALSLDHTQLLDDYNPVSLQSLFVNDGNNLHVPSIIWVQGQNAFWSRHLLRTSGLDRVLQHRCGSNIDSDNCVFVGEGAGSRCAGTTMAVAHAHGDDPKVATELQSQGLHLLGHNRWVSFGVDRPNLETHRETRQVVPNIEICDENQVFVWSQSSQNHQKQDRNKELATTFIMTPCRKGMIERYNTPDPLPPLVISELPSLEGVACNGEPSIDPSRVVQNLLCDSEWLDEFTESWHY
jgi:peptidase E